MIRRLGLCFWLLPSIVLATDYYVATTGNDATGTGAIGAPWQTIAKGLTVAGASDTLFIRGGTYVENVTTDTATITGGSSWATKLTIAGYPDEIVSIRPASGEDVIHLASATARYVELTNLDIDATNVTNQAIKITYVGHASNQSDHIRISDSLVHGCLTGNGILVTSAAGTGLGGFNEFIRLKVYANGVGATRRHGMYISTSDNLISDSEIFSNTYYGIHIYLTSPTNEVNRNLVLNNRIHDNGLDLAASAGLLLSSGEENEAHGNSIWNNGYGIQMSDHSVDSIATGNCIWGNRLGAFTIFGDESGSVSSPNTLAACPGIGAGIDRGGVGQ